jgi:MGT family glycosyltransferase
MKSYVDFPRKTVEGLKPKRILFASVPADGHFNPLTGIAMELMQRGYEVAWYASAVYAEKLQRLGIRHFPFKKALEVNGENIDTIFPERNNHKSQIAKLNFDMEHFFIRRSTEYYDDICELRHYFSFDCMIADVAFSAIPLVKEKLHIPVISIGVFPLVETSKDLAPIGLGLTPATGFLGKRKQDLLRYISDRILFRKPNRLMKETLGDYGIETADSNVFDILVRKSTLMLQSGTPGFEYARTDLGSNIRFIGPLLPFQQQRTEKWFDERINLYKKIILVTQGTVEKDPSKIIEPVLNAFRHTGHLVIATTGGSRTEQLKAAYPDHNFIIEDFIPFSDVMPFADVYVTNGGYGGVMLGIENKLPMVVAGIHEGKNEINARIGYFGLGVNLQTETPDSTVMRSAVEKVLNDPLYKKNVEKLGSEFRDYNATGLAVHYVEQLLTEKEEKLNNQAA